MSKKAYFSGARENLDIWPKKVLKGEWVGCPSSLSPLEQILDNSSEYEMEIHFVQDYCFLHDSFGRSRCTRLHRRNRRKVVDQARKDTW